MNIREELVAKVQNLPESDLPRVYDFVEKIEIRRKGPGLLRRLQKIKIDGPPDFSRNIDLYLNGEKLEEDFD